MGPAFHAVFPKSNCMKKPKLLSLVVFFQYLSSAYPFVQQELLSLNDLASKGKLSSASTVLVQNWILLLEFLLPVVSFPLPS